MAWQDMVSEMPMLEPQRSRIWRRAFANPGTVGARVEAPDKARRAGSRRVNSSATTSMPGAPTTRNVSLQGCNVPSSGSVTGDMCMTACATRPPTSSASPAPSCTPIE